MNTAGAPLEVNFTGTEAQRWDLLLPGLGLRLGSPPAGGHRTLYLSLPICEMGLQQPPPLLQNSMGLCSVGHRCHCGSSSLTTALHLGLGGLGSRTQDPRLQVGPSQQGNNAQLWENNGPFPACQGMRITCRIMQSPIKPAAVTQAPDAASAINLGGKCCSSSLRTRAGEVG